MFADIREHIQVGPFSDATRSSSPESWTVRRLRSILRNVIEPVTQLDVGEFYIGLQHVEGWTGRYRVDPLATFEGAAKHFAPTDVIFGKLRPYLAKVAHPGAYGACSGEFLVLRPVDTAVTPEFLRLLLGSKPVVDMVDGSTYGAKMPRAEWTFIGNARLAIPPADEQAAIVKYLGHAHARIDRAIAAKRKLIALLEEQKQAIIHQAVTRGLDPNVPLKDSGIPWLGEIPAHWTLEPTRKVLALTKTIVGDAHPDYTLLSLTLRGVIERDMINPEGKFPSDFSTYQAVEAGQFVFCMFDVDETPRTVGLSQYSGMITGAYRVFDCPRPEWAEFAELYFLALDRRKALRPLYTGLRKSIPVGAFLQAKMPFPPDGERDAIVRTVRHEIVASEHLREHTSREIELLREFRTRLTSDVVTGQVDVREIAASLPELTDDMLASTVDDAGDSLEDIAEEFLEGETD